MLTFNHERYNEIKNGDKHKRHQPILSVFHVQILDHLCEFEHDHRQCGNQKSGNKNQSDDRVFTLVSQVATSLYVVEDSKENRCWH